jgi:hypothetical protein
VRSSLFETPNAIIDEGDIWGMLNRNSTQGQSWQEYRSPDAESRYFRTTDGKLFASIWRNNSAQVVLGVANQSWSDRKSAREGTVVNEQPPIQEDAMNPISYREGEVTISHFRGDILTAATKDLC